MDKFVDQTLRSDGVFVLRLIAANSGDLITTDIVAALWKRFLEDEVSAGGLVDNVTACYARGHGFESRVFFEALMY